MKIDGQKKFTESYVEKIPLEEKVLVYMSSPKAWNRNVFNGTIRNFQIFDTGLKFKKGEFVFVSMKNNIS